MSTRTRVVLTFFYLALVYTLHSAWVAMAAPVEAALAVSQVNDSIASYGFTSLVIRSGLEPFVALGTALLLVLSLWLLPLRNAYRVARSWVPLCALAALGCGPPRVLPLEIVGPNETAFVIPLEGATSKQEKFESVEFLARHKVATKRIEVPVRERSIGRMWWDYEWIPTVRVIKVDRSLVTREWSDSASKKTSNAIAVESLDSIGFHAGVNLTAFITEEDAAIYLYFHTNKPLAEVVDQNVRGFIQDQLATAFGELSLEESKKQKSRIFALTETATIEHFKKYGVTISNIGNAGGLEFDDPKIQAAINDTANAEMSIQVAVKEKLAQDERNKRIVASAQAEAEAAREFAKAQEAQVAKVRLEIERMRAEADLTAAQRWNGQTPSGVVPSGSNFLFGLDAKR